VATICSRITMVAVMCSAVAAAHADPERVRGILGGRIVEAELLTPIEGATVVVTSASSRESEAVVSTLTDANGRFSYSLPPGKYDILAIFSDSRWVRRNLTVSPGQVTEVPGVLAVGAEVTTIREHVGGNVVPASVERSTIKPQLPYSHQAIDENLWAVGWVLLDVSETGVVSGFRFLRRPEHGLDGIAESEIWNMRFKPAHDASGRPMASRVLWKLEWPAYYWARDRVIRRTARDDSVTLGSAVGTRASLNEKPTPRGINLDTIQVSDDLSRSSDALPNCRGSAPLQLDGTPGVYRDCSLPDLTKINSEPLIPRPADR